MTFFKTTALAATVTAFAASSALAGGMAEPIMTMEPMEVMEEAAGSSSGGLLIPLILIALIAVATNSSSAPTPEL